MNLEVSAWLIKNVDKIEDIVRETALMVVEWEMDAWDEESRTQIEPWSVDKAGYLLDRECRKLVARVGGQEGRRNDYLNWLGYRIGRKAVAAGVPVDAVRARLTRAGLEAGLGHGEVERTVRSSLGLSGWSGA